MALESTQVYEIELWSPAGALIADISSLARNRRFTVQRNEAEELDFDLDLYAFERFAASINTNPNNLIVPYWTDVKLKRNGVYLYGFQVIAAVFNLPGEQSTNSTGSMSGSPSSFSPTVSITCQGYLNFFADRYTDNAYVQTDACAIATDLITTTQAIVNGNMGITIDTGNYMTGVLRDRTYSRDNIKLKLQELTQLVDGRFDFGFSYDKKFKTYSQIGAIRGDLQLIYGGDTGNVAGLYFEYSGHNLYNQIIGLGSGFGADQLTSIQGDTVSQQTYGLRQQIQQFNSVVEQATLDQNTKAALALAKDPLDIPQVIITGRELVGLPWLSVGDRIPFTIVGHPWLSILSNTYRLEKMVVTLDDNDFESNISLYFDDFDLIAGT